MKPVLIVCTVLCEERAPKKKLHVNVSQVIFVGKGQCSLTSHSLEPLVLGLSLKTQLLSFSKGFSKHDTDRLMRRVRYFYDKKKKKNKLDEQFAVHDFYSNKLHRELGILRTDSITSALPTHCFETVM